MGIKKENEKNIFKLFGSHKQNKVNTEGIGLGLMISKMIVEHFDGIINFTSEYKKGSIFYYTFRADEFLQEELSPRNLNSLLFDDKGNIPQFNVLEDR